jgi:hypothetical protein
MGEILKFKTMSSVPKFYLRRKFEGNLVKWKEERIHKRIILELFGSPHEEGGFKSIWVAGRIVIDFGGP